MTPAFLPRSRSAFFGRHRELGEIREGLVSHRMVTLTGVGGGGKTRLALRIAQDSVPNLAEKIGWVELAPIANPRLVVQSVCSSLEIVPPPGTAPIAALVQRLNTSPWLLVLDNCEHLADACAEMATTLIEECPDLRIIATSREPLAVPDELVYPVGPLSIPETPDPEKAMDSSSVQLLTDRTRSVQPNFKVTPENVEAVVQLCRKLEGIPLALELAAARTKILSVHQIVQRLDQGLALLGSSGDEKTSRHQTMGATLQWSHDLLSSHEQMLFRRLGVFGGGADISACETVCSDERVPAASILDLLTSLCEKSLIVVHESDHVARYRLLEPIRQFAVERLDASGERNEVYGRHAAYYRNLACSMAPDLHTKKGAYAVRLFQADHGNFRNAWDHAAEVEDLRTVESLARSLFWFWQFGGHFTEARTRAEETLDKLASHKTALPATLHTAGALAWNQGEYELAEQRLTECSRICAQHSRDGLHGIALRDLASVRLAMGGLAGALECYVRSAELLRQVGRHWDLALNLLMLADVRDASGEHVDATVARKEARKFFGQANDPWGLSLVHFSMGMAAARAGDLDQARIHGREAMALISDRADHWNIGQFQALLGEVELLAGHTDDASNHFTESVRSFREVGDRTSLVHVIQCLSECERRLGHTLRAVQLAAAATSHRETLESEYVYELTDQAHHERTIDALRDQCRKNVFADEWALGGKLDFEEMVDLALADPAPAKVGAASLEQAQTTTLQIFSLGQSQVLRGKRALRPSDWTFALPRELLYFLLVNGPRTKEQIGIEFWPEASDAQLRGRFRTVLYQLRRALGGTEWILYKEGRYEFNRALSYWFDAESFEDHLDEALQLIDKDPGAAADCLQRAIDLYRGEFLEGDSPGDWAHEHRERLHQRYFEALLSLGRLHTAQGAFSAASERFRQAVKQDPLSEPAYRALARSLAAQGNQAAALQCLDALNDSLRRELDVEPSHRTRSLRAELLDQHPS